MPINRSQPDSTAAIPATVDGLSLTRIVSGGQTGVDRAALDAAINAGIAIGGWCPRGRRSEDGRVPAHYNLNETDARSYAIRTEWNVRDSDATLILALDEISSGTRLTIEAARQLAKPCKVEHLLPPRKTNALIEDLTTREQQVTGVIEWLKSHEVQILNVAGPRGSSSPLVYPKAVEFMTSVLNELRSRSISQ